MLFRSHKSPLASAYPPSFVPHDILSIAAVAAPSTAFLHCRALCTISSLRELDRLTSIRPFCSSHSHLLQPLNVRLFAAFSGSSFLVEHIPLGPASIDDLFRFPPVVPGCLFETIDADIRRRLNVDAGGICSMLAWPDALCRSTSAARVEEVSLV